MSIGESQGGLPPDTLTEKESFILSESQRLIETYNDSSRYSMQRVALAPCSPFSVSIDLMRESAAMARSYGVGLHTHLAENVEDIEYGLQQFGMRPGEYIEAVGWTGDDVWHAHCVQLNSEEINLFAKTGTGIAHCPCSNMRLASGIAPVRQMLDSGVKVGLGVDGSASNDSGNMLNEARQTMLLQRVNSKASSMTAREALKVATRGGASVLNRDDIGVLAPGYAADITAFKRNNVDFSGSDWDPVASLVFCGPGKANYTIINGKIIVSEGQLTTVPMEKLIHEHNKLSHNLINLQT
jgi:cytosine/adenosine deaminase-related metal-dependent hydrolase